MILNRSVDLFTSKVTFAWLVSDVSTLKILGTILSLLCLDSCSVPLTLTSEVEPVVCLASSVEVAAGLGLGSLVAE